MDVPLSITRNKQIRRFCTTAATVFGLTLKLVLIFTTRLRFMRFLSLVFQVLLEVSLNFDYARIRFRKTGLRRKNFSLV